MSITPDCDGSHSAASDTDAPGTPLVPGPVFQDPRSVSRALGQSVLGWEKIGITGQWLVNSHPKSGTHLIRNILLHFNSTAVHQHILFFNTFESALGDTGAPRVLIGHVPHVTLSRAGPKAATLRHVLLLRHPCAIALALARAFYDSNSTRADHLYMREHDSFEEIVSKVVTGYECQGQRFGSLASSLTEFCLEWLSRTEFVLRFEDIAAKLRSDDADLLAYFGPMLNAMFEILPSDAAQRIRAGGSAAISATYSRAGESPYDVLQPGDVYHLLPASHARQLQNIAAELGY